MPLKKLIRQVIKKSVKKTTTSKKKMPPKARAQDAIKYARSPVKRPAIRYSPGGKGKKAKANPLGQMGLRARPKKK